MNQKVGTAVLVLPPAGGAVFISRRLACPDFNGQLCGGRVEAGEAGEAWATAATRELREEMGLDARGRLELVCSDHKQLASDGQPFTVVFFCLRLDAGEVPQDLEPDKHGPWHLATTRDLRSRLDDLLPGLAAFVRTSYWDEVVG